MYIELQVIRRVGNCNYNYRCGDIVCYYAEGIYMYEAVPEMETADCILPEPKYNADIFSNRVFIKIG